MIDEMFSKIVKDSLGEKDKKEIEENFLRLFSQINNIESCMTYPKVLMYSTKKNKGLHIESRYVSNIELGENYIKLNISDAMVDIYKNLVKKIKNGKIR